MLACRGILGRVPQNGLKGRCSTTELRPCGHKLQLYRKTRILASRSPASNGRTVLFNRHWPLPLPFVFPAQARLVLLHLRFNFAERLLATSQHILPVSGGVQRPIRQRQRQRARLLFRSLILRKHSLQLNHVRLITLQQPVQFIQPPITSTATGCCASTCL